MQSCFLRSCCFASALVSLDKCLETMSCCIGIIREGQTSFNTVVHPTTTFILCVNRHRIRGWAAC